MQLGQRTWLARRSARLRLQRRKPTREPPVRWNSSSVPANRLSRCCRSKTSSETSFTTSGRRATAAPSADRRTMLVEYTTSFPRPRRAICRTAAACLTPGGKPRDTQVTRYSRGCGSASAVVTTSTECPRPRRNSASAGAWLAGPPGSGGQMPETIRTFTAPFRSRAGSGPRPSTSEAAGARPPTTPRTRASTRARRPPLPSHPTPRRGR